MPAPPLSDAQARAAVAALLAANGNTSQAARNLGINRCTLQGQLAVARRRGFMPDVDPSAMRPPTASPGAIPRSEPGCVVSPKEHAETRARSLGADVAALVTGTRYPLINPDAIRIESFVTQRYNRRAQRYEDCEGQPRAWLTETLRVAPVPDARGRTFLFTGAQNDAEIHAGFWRNLQAYARHLGAEIVVGPWTYETAWWSENNPASRSYADEIADHMCFGQMAIGDRFVFCGEMNTLPTAARPISDLVTYSRGKWAVFPHAKIQLKSVPSTDPQVQAHQVMTTGAVTLPKVIPRKAGVKSIFHHIIGATLVEFDGDGDVFCRQINASDDGSFYDLDRYVTDGQVTTGHRAKAIVFGDFHARKLDPANAAATFGFGGDAQYLDSLIGTLRPELAILHDVFDNEARNHHHVGDSAYSYEMAIRKRDRVLDEIREAADFIAKVRDRDRQVVVIDSNHDLGLERYVREGRYRNDGANVRVGLQLEDAYMAYRERAAMAQDAGSVAPTFSLFEHAARMVREDALDGVSWVHDGQSFVVDEVECGNHGFRGANGTRGSVVGFARIGRKMSIGDKHSPEIMDGVYCAGCMNLSHGYNKGPSSWAVAHTVQYPNGKRTLITLQRGKWRAQRPRVRVRAKAA